MTSFTRISGAEAPADKTDRACARDPIPIDGAGVLDQARGLRAGLARDFDQPHRIRRIGRADHQHDVGRGAIALIASWRLVVA